MDRSHSDCSLGLPPRRPLECQHTSYRNTSDHNTRDAQRSQTNTARIHSRPPRRLLLPGERIVQGLCETQSLQVIRKRETKANVFITSVDFVRVVYNQAPTEHPDDDQSPANFSTTVANT